MAVKILKKGNLDRLNKKLTFSCESCGCITACNTDYKIQYSQREGKGWYEIKCPYCNNWVTLNDDDAEEQWKGVNQDGGEDAE